MCIAKHHATLSQRSEVGRGDGVSVRRDLAADIVAVEIENIQRKRGDGSAKIGAA